MVQNNNIHFIIVVIFSIKKCYIRMLHFLQLPPRIL
uniref:Uncharacterized protein n=1 Tax=Anguilla anguilla TaxID=7936 RepID=A0A0E9UH47_ANGAN